MSIGSKISDLRKERKLTQCELAEKLNVSDKVISRWETGTSLPDVEMMRNISAVFGVTISELYDESDEVDVNERTMQHADCERIWKYKRSTIIACALFCAATLLAIAALLTVIIINTVALYAKYETVRIVVAILSVLSVISACVSIVLEVVSASGLRSFSNTKQHRTLYENALKQYVKTYAILCATCVAVLIVMIILMICFL